MKRINLLSQITTENRVVNDNRNVGRRRRTEAQNTADTMMIGQDGNSQRKVLDN
jgi:hypothetical protein